MGIIKDHCLEYAEVELCLCGCCVAEVQRPLRGPRWVRRIAHHRMSFCAVWGMGENT